MLFENCKKEFFNEKIGEKKIICFGASKILQRYYELHFEWFENWKHQIAYFVDNDSTKWNTTYRLGESVYDINNPQVLDDEKDYILLITTNETKALEIITSLKETGSASIRQVYVLPMILFSKECDDSVVSEDMETEKPIVNNKIIHTFWFSGDPIPEKYQKCMDSWKKYCPDYEIKIWNSDTYDVKKNKYMYQAYEAKKWAFVSDYARLDVVYQYGGIYMDMDVEVIKPLDKLLQLESFFAIDMWKQIDLGTCFGAKKGNPIIKILLESYENEQFVNEHGSMNLTPQPAKLIDFFEKCGFKRKVDSQKINETYFLSMNYLDVYEGNRIPDNRKSGKEFLIHWHHAGWKSPEYYEQRYINNYESLELLEKMWEEERNMKE